ncbi:uncharacterized protein LOC142173503 [Nicotiana tabacum]|uniref:Uncharacterized protein LOC142173503 n=1 Tax=Nicotiana tabacum TaxID=4097 RepID=A0AC58TDA1_TOBAC
MIFVYAKCSSLERLELWDNLYYLASNMELPWLVGGDFNVVLHKDEKIEGLSVHPPEYDDFSFCTNSCGLLDQGYKGSPFTWWNGRPNVAIIFKILDRIFVNLPFQNMLPIIEVEHLIRTGSDHAPLLMTGGKKAANFARPFRFLNFWTKHETFMQTFGDIFKQLEILEDIVKVKEMLFEEESIIENIIILQRTQSELKKYLSLEEQYWKKKLGMTWFAEGYRNKRFFHNHVNGKRKKLQKNGNPTKFSMLNNVPAMVSMDHNLELCSYPTLEEVKAAVFGLNGNSSSGPDKFTSMFYQECWEIICNDIHNMVLHFFGGAALPKSITHTNLVMLPKKQRPESFSDPRPISLSNFVNKVLSRCLHNRLEKFLPEYISPNQSGFVKERSIFENILLTQEIVTNIKKRGKPANMVIKLDMSKAYNRVS